MSTNLPSPQAEEFLSGKFSQVDVAAIEKQLRSLWHQAAQGDPDTGEGPVVRACSFNLVLLTNDDDAETKCSDLLDEIEIWHPCRSLLAIYRPRRPHHLEAWVSARCHRIGESKQICSEQITVLSEGGKPQELASVVRPLVLPDLPVFLWWRQSRLNWSEFHSLHACARRFILDSSLEPFDHQILIDAARLIEENCDCLTVSDLSWRRLHGWCRAVADAFDGFPMPVERLTKIKTLAITFNGTGEPSNQAILFCAWLARRLGWQVDSFKNDVASFKASGGNVVCKFVADSKGGQDGNPVSVRMEFLDSTDILTVGVERTNEAVFIVARKEGSTEHEATRVSHDLSEAILVGQEVENLKSDAVYEASADMASKLAEVRAK